MANVASAEFPKAAAITGLVVFILDDARRTSVDPPPDAVEDRARRIFTLRFGFGN